MTKALIFDFDGVLVLSEGPRFKAIKAIAAKHGIDIPDDKIGTSYGKTTANFLTEIFGVEKQSIVDMLMTEFRKDYLGDITKHVEPIDFTVNFIRNYTGHLPIAIASMSSTITIEVLLRHFGIYEKISKIVSRDDVVHHKPDPEIYLKTSTVLDIHPENCLVFEDTALGAQAALSAGMHCCVVLNGTNERSSFKGMNIAGFVDSTESLLTLSSWSV